MSPLSNNPQEWLEQAENDLKAAEAVLKTGYHFYSVFLCHLSVEKGLKSLVFKKTNIVPPRTHNLALLLRKAECEMPEHLIKHLLTLNEAHLVTRYPEEFKSLQKKYHEEHVKQIISLCQETLEWIKNKF